MSPDDGYRLHFLVPDGHIGFMIESPILHIKHQARLIPYSKSCTWNQNEDSISSGFRDTAIWSKSKLVGGSHLYSKYNESFYIYTSCHFNSTGLKTCRWNQKRRFYLKRFPSYANFSKSNMAAVAILYFWHNCSYYIYDTMLDLFIGVENIGVEFKIKSLCWSSSEI